MEVKKYKRPPKYVRLRLSDKLDILRRLDAGESREEIARIYNIARTTITWIKKKRERILWYSQIQGPAGPETLQAKKMMNHIEDTPFEKALFAWFKEKRNAGEAISGPAIQEEALRLNKELGGPSDFKASNGWLSRFKKRHGIRQLSLQGVKLGSVDFDSAKSFCDEFEKIIEENQCTPDNIYNAIRTGLQWNALPQKTVDTSTGKVLKDRVPLIACVNADGSHKLPMMVVGRSKNPRSFKDFEIPVKYVFHGNGFPNEALFEEWFQDMFIPAVKKRHEEIGKKGKIVLLIDMVPSFLLLNLAEENDVKITILPPHVTTLIQPLNQGILDRFKKHYKQSFFKEMLIQKDEKVVNVADKRWTMKDCCFSIAAAWDSFSVEDFQMAWRKLLKLNELDDRNNQILFLSCGVTEDEEKPNEKNMLDDTMNDHESSSLSLAPSSMQNVSSSMDLDESCETSSESGCFVANENAPENTQKEFQEERTNSGERDSTSGMETIPTSPSTKDALNAVNTIFKWLKHQENPSRQDILDVVNLRSLILNKITSNVPT